MSHKKTGLTNQIFAISGHRLLIRPEIATQEVVNLFSTLNKKRVLLSGFAEGADQLVAEIALNFSAQGR